MLTTFEEFSEVIKMLRKVKMWINHFEELERLVSFSNFEFIDHTTAQIGQIFFENASFGINPGLNKKKSDQNYLITEETEPNPNNLNSVLIRSLNLSIEASKKYEIQGLKGQSSSAILMGFVGEIPLLEGYFRLSGKVTLCPKEPSIIDGTLKDNIYLGTNLIDEEKYNEIFEICKLQIELDKRGLTENCKLERRDPRISKEMAQKLTLARSLVNDADIFIFDDCLDSLDQKEADLIYEALFKGILKGKTVIFFSVSHNLEKEFDYVMKVDEFWKISLYPNFEMIQEPPDSTRIQTVKKSMAVSHVFDTPKSEFNGSLKSAKRSGHGLDAYFEKSPFVPLKKSGLPQQARARKKHSLIISESKGVFIKPASVTALKADIAVAKFQIEMQSLPDENSASDEITSKIHQENNSPYFPSTQMIDDKYPIKLELKPLNIEIKENEHRNQLAIFNPPTNPNDRDLIIKPKIEEKASNYQKFSSASTLRVGFILVWCSFASIKIFIVFWLGQSTVYRKEKKEMTLHNSLIILLGSLLIIASVLTSFLHVQVVRNFSTKFMFHVVDLLAKKNINFSPNRSKSYFSFKFLTDVTSIIESLAASKVAVMSKLLHVVSYLTFISIAMPFAIPFVVALVALAWIFSKKKKKIQRKLSKLKEKTEQDLFFQIENIQDGLVMLRNPEQQEFLKKNLHEDLSTLSSIETLSRQARSSVTVVSDCIFLLLVLFLWYAATVANSQR